MPRETASQKALQNPSNTHFYVVQKDPQAAAAPSASTSTEKTLLLLVAATSIERTAAHQTKHPSVLTNSSSFWLMPADTFIIHDW